MVEYFPSILQKRYRTIKTLGSGGYGIVALAQDERLNRRVALKRLHPAITDRRQKIRIQREAHIMAGLNHPNILKIYDVFEEKGVLYLAMEYANGGSLEQLLQRKSYSRGLPVEDVISIALAVSSALKAAHNVDIIHRDIKPGNILLLDTGSTYVVKLSDFGIAHLSIADTVLTKTGEIVGTPIYLTPEQISGNVVSTATDIYALGILLYRLLINKHYLPVTSNEKEMQRRILNDPPEAIDTARNVPAWLTTLIFQMLAKEPAKRPTLKSIVRQFETHRSTGFPRKSPFQQINFLSPHRRPIMRNFIKSVLLLAIAVWLFNLSGGTLPSIPNIPLELPTGSEIASFTTDMVARLTPVSKNSVAVVTGANQYNGLKLRRTPSRSGIIIDLLSDGTRVQVIRYSVDRNWAFVETVSHHNRGWVYADYLSPSP